MSDAPQAKNFGPFSTSLRIGGHFSASFREMITKSPKSRARCAGLRTPDMTPECVLPAAGGNPVEPQPARDVWRGRGCLVTPFLSAYDAACALAKALWTSEWPCRSDARPPCSDRGYEIVLAPHVAHLHREHCAVGALSTRPLHASYLPHIRQLPRLLAVLPYDRRRLHRTAAP